MATKPTNDALRMCREFRLTLEVLQVEYDQDFKHTGAREAQSIEDQEGCIRSASNTNRNNRVSEAPIRMSKCSWEGEGEGHPPRIDEPAAVADDLGSESD